MQPPKLLPYSQKTLAFASVAIVLPGGHNTIDHSTKIEIDGADVVREQLTIHMVMGDI